MRFLLRLLWFLVLAFLIRYLIIWLFFPRAHSSARQVPPSRGLAHKDPQCGIYVAEELALMVSVDGQAHYFCSAECRDRFLARRAIPGASPPADAAD